MLQAPVDARLTAVLRSLEAFEEAYVPPATLDASYGPDSLRRAKQELVSLKSLDALLPRQRGTQYNMTAPLRRLSKECLQSLCQSLELVLSEGLDSDKQSLVAALVQFISMASISLSMHHCAVTSNACWCSSMLCCCKFKQRMLVLQYILPLRLLELHAFPNMRFGNGTWFVCASLHVYRPACLFFAVIDAVHASNLKIVAAVSGQDRLHKARCQAFQEPNE